MGRAAVLAPSSAIRQGQISTIPQKIPRFWRRELVEIYFVRGWDAKWMRDKVAQQWCVVEGAWKICHRYAWIPFCTSIQNRQNSPSTRAGSKRPFYFFLLGPYLLLLAQMGRRGQTPPATPSAYDQYWEALCEWKLKGCPLSAGNEASPNKRNDLSLTSIFSFLLLKSDGRSHGEVRRATFDSKDS